MQKVRYLFPLSRCLHRNCSISRQGRSFSSVPSLPNTIISNKKRPVSESSLVLVEDRANSRAAILNRPSALNALTASMATRLNRLHDSWEENSNIGLIMMKGGGCKAFCSGTDVVALYKLLNEVESIQVGRSK